CTPPVCLLWAAAVFPEREVLVSGDGKVRISYAEMDARVNRLANSLAARGTGAGSRVAVLATNSPEYVEVYYACAKLGACLVPLNFRAKTEELTYMLNESETEVLFVEPRYLDLLAGIKPQLTTLKHAFRFGAGQGSFDELLAAG